MLPVSALRSRHSKCVRKLVWVLRALRATKIQPSKTGFGLSADIKKPDFTSGFFRLKCHCLVGSYQPAVDLRHAALAVFADQRLQAQVGHQIDVAGLR